MKIKVLNDDIGYIYELGHCGNDLSVLESTVNHFDVSHHAYDGDDDDILNYFSEQGILKPFSHVQLQFQIRMPLFVLNTWAKHSLGIVRTDINDISDCPEFYTPNFWRKHSLKQDDHESSDKFVKTIHNQDGSFQSPTTMMMRAVSDSQYTYASLIEAGVTHVQAQMALPQSMYTSFNETGSIVDYAQIVNLAMQDRNQREVQYYAITIDEIMRTIAPKSWAALTVEKETSYAG